MTSKGGIRKDRRQFLEHPLDKNWRFRAYLEKGDFVINIEYIHEGKIQSVLRFDQSHHTNFHCDYLNQKLKEFQYVKTIEEKIQCAFEFIKSDLKYIITYKTNKIELNQNVLNSIKDQLLNEIKNPQYGKQTCSHSITLNMCLKKETNFKETEIEKIPERPKNLNENMGFLLKIIEDVRKETEGNQKENVYVWSEHYSNWIDIWKYFNEDMGKEDFLNSCIAFRLTQLNKELLWFWLECTSGLYDNANRTLRYVLESFLQAYYVDNNHPNASMECKLEILKEIDRLMGGKLIENLGIDGKYKKQIKSLYSDLCKFIHPSYEEWQKIIEHEKADIKVTFGYDKKSFEECIELTDKVIDVIVFLLMNIDNRMIEKIKKDEIFLKSIKDVKNSLVIQYINDTGKKK